MVRKFHLDCWLVLRNLDWGLNRGLNRGLNCELSRDLSRDLSLSLSLNWNLTLDGNVNLRWRKQRCRTDAIAGDRKKAIVCIECGKTSVGVIDWIHNCVNACV